MINLLEKYQKGQAITLKRMHGQQNISATIHLVMEDALIVQVSGYEGTASVTEDMIA